MCEPIRLAEEPAYEYDGVKGCASVYPIVPSKPGFPTFGVWLGDKYIGEHEDVANAERAADAAAGAPIEWPVTDEDY